MIPYFLTQTFHFESKGKEMFEPVDQIKVGQPARRVSGQRRSSLRLPKEPCVRIPARLFMQGVSIEKHQTHAPTFGRIEFHVLSG